MKLYGFKKLTAENEKKEAYQSFARLVMINGKFMDFEEAVAGRSESNVKRYY